MVLLVSGDCLLIYLLSVMLSDRHMFIWYWRELYISCKSCVQSNCIYLKICFNQLWYDVRLIIKLTLSVHLNVIIKNLIQSNMRKLRQSPDISMYNIEKVNDDR
jgi:hypothetical protein